MFRFIARVLLAATLLAQGAPLAWAGGIDIAEPLAVASEAPTALPCHGGADNPETVAWNPGCAQGCPCAALCAASVNEPMAAQHGAATHAIPPAAARYGEPAPAHPLDLLRPPNVLHG